jgi:hypothetical protein
LGVSIPTCETDAFRLEFTVRAGWCRMYITVDDGVTVYSATSIVDAVGSFAHAVADIATGEIVASCLWGDEPGGVFVDLARPLPSHVLLVIHELAMPGWLTPEDQPMWLPVRGRPLLAVRVATKHFLAEVVSALGSLEQLIGDGPDAGIKGWGHRHPAESAVRIRDGLGEFHASTRRGEAHDGRPGQRASELPGGGDDRQ